MNIYFRFLINLPHRVILFLLQRVERRLGTSDRTHRHTDTSCRRWSLKQLMKTPTMKSHPAVHLYPPRHRSCLPAYDGLPRGGFQKPLLCLSASYNWAQRSSVYSESECL